MTLNDEHDGRYIKPSQRKTPQKANHPHEYIRVVSWAKLRFPDGHLTEEKHRITLPIQCVICGHRVRREPNNLTEITVSLSEFREQMQELGTQA